MIDIKPDPTLKEPASQPSSFKKMGTAALVGAAKGAAKGMSKMTGYTPSEHGPNPYIRSTTEGDSGPNPITAAAEKGLKMHKGGIVPGKKGQNVPAILKAGERVIPTGQADAKVKIKIKGMDAMKALGAGEPSGPEFGKGGVPKSRRSPVITEPSTQFPLHKLPAGMEIPSNSEGAPVHDFGGAKSRQAENQAKRAQKEASFT